MNDNYMEIDRMINEGGLVGGYMYYNYGPEQLEIPDYDNRLDDKIRSENHS